MKGDVVFLLDVDNTLLDNDRVVADLHEYLETAIGSTGASRYWDMLEALRSEHGYVDYLGALQACRDEAHGKGGNEVEKDCERYQCLLKASSFLLDYPFADRLYPHALEVVAHLAQCGQTVILSDGDVVFQPRKVMRSGLWDAVEGRVLVYIHKERMLSAVQKHYPARHYVMVDDKPNILAAMKAHWQDRVTTVFPRQGHYAMDATLVAAHPGADVCLEHIGELAAIDLKPLFAKSLQRAA